MSFAAALRAEIAAAPVTVATYMARCNAHYYATRDPLGAAGDFTTAPEISQMFGELLGAWFAAQWLAAGSPTAARLVELGPGRGTMMADMRRGVAAAKWSPEIVLVETSPVLAAAQARRVPGATGTTDLNTVPDDAPLFLVANEFFDALPVRQFEHTPAGWRERLVVATDAGLAVAVGPSDVRALVPAALVGSPIGSVVETCPAASALAADVAARLAHHGGAALIVDYGHAGPAIGETLQAVRRHSRADPFAAPGDADLTAHVDFAALAGAAKAGGAIRAWGPVGQGPFLRSLGIAARAATLKARATDAQSAAIDVAVARLTGEAAMGTLFKVMALTPATAAAPAGFA